ncbi:MAG: malonic semialdehyde reductase [Parvularculaceae bacterium]
MTDPIADSALDAIFRTARTYSHWDGRAVSETLIRAVYDLMRYGPTSANCSPARFVFVTSKAAKARLEPHLAKGNVEQTMSAPMTVIIAHDMKFYELLPKLYPHTDAASWFTGNDALIEETAFRNGTLQGAYLMIAARALGLDCGPMSGFDMEGVDKEFFPDGRYRSNFLCNIGYGDASKLHPRSPRLEFEEACEIL